MVNCKSFYCARWWPLRGCDELGQWFGTSRLGRPSGGGFRQQSNLLNLRLSSANSLCTSRVLGAGVNSVNTGAVIGNKLDNQIFEVSYSAAWKIKICQSYSLNCSRNFISNRNATTCAYDIQSRLECSALTYFSNRDEKTFGSEIGVVLRIPQNLYSSVLP